MSQVGTFQFSFSNSSFVWIIQYYQSEEYFRGPKDGIIHNLQNEIFELRSKLGNYDILRKNMIELELKYRDLYCRKANTEQDFK